MSQEPPIVPNPVATGADSKTEKSRLAKILDSKAAVLGLLFLAMAALGLPLLWKSPAFGRTEKAIWSLLVLLYTALILWAFCAVMWWSYSQIKSSF
ncbi:MAG TPA: hypothetical protein DDW52_09160 [Planctomycetaceae bacterium]|nr:hypothetical protein [Planctomycetaceae bacterium]